MKNIYITPFEYAKLNFADFIFSLFKKETCLNSFSISFFHKNQIINGHQFLIGNVIEIIGINFISYHSSSFPVNEEKNTLLFSHVNFTTLMNLLFSQPKYNHFHINESECIANNHHFNLKEKDIFDLIVYHKNKLSNEINISNFSNQIYHFQKDNLENDVQKFIGEELPIKQYTNFLENTLTKKEINEDIKFKI